MSEVKNSFIHEQTKDDISIQQTPEQLNNSIVRGLVNTSLPATYNPDTFISKIAQKNNISQSQARGCLLEAIKILEEQKPKSNKEVEKNEAQDDYEPENTNNDAYFWRYGYTKTTNFHNDGMDSLSSLSSYNKLMFGIR